MTEVIFIALVAFFAGLLVGKSFEIKKAAKALKPKKSDIVYSHWDLKALARMIDPQAWEEFDKLNKYRDLYYENYPVKKSFKQAVILLKDQKERILPWKPLLSEEQLENWVHQFKKDNPSLKAAA